MSALEAATRGLERAKQLVRAAEAEEAEAKAQKAAHDRAAKYWTDGAKQIAAATVAMQEALDATRGLIAQGRVIEAQDAYVMYRIREQELEVISNAASDALAFYKDDNENPVPRDPGGLVPGNVDGRLYYPAGVGPRRSDPVKWDQVYADGLELLLSARAAELRGEILERIA